MCVRGGGAARAAAAEAEEEALVVKQQELRNASAVRVCLGCVCVCGGGGMVRWVEEGGEGERRWWRMAIMQLLHTRRCPLPPIYIQFFETTSCFNFPFSLYG